MGYASLSLGIIFAIFAQMCVKMSKGFKVLLPTITAFILFIFTNFFISSAIRYFEMGIVYAVWSALTIILTALLGIFLFGESVNRQKVVSIFALVSGVIILNLV